LIINHYNLEWWRDLPKKHLVDAVDIVIVDGDETVDEHEQPISLLESSSWKSPSIKWWRLSPTKSTGSKASSWHVGIK
jgi:hypothetical protein